MSQNPDRGTEGVKEAANDEAKSEQSAVDKQQLEIEKEWITAIKRRRTVALGDEPEKPLENLVGVALSGGGLRSAIFNVGLLQAFSHRGLLRYVDSISSVSGGGYANGWLTARVQKYSADRTKALEGGRTQQAGDGTANTPTLALPNADSAPLKIAIPPKSFHESRESHLGLDPKTEQLQPSYGLARCGNYLFRVTEVAARWAFDTLKMILLIGSAYLALSALVAIIWRSLDQETARRVLNVFNVMEIADEFLVAFLPVVMLFATWAGASLMYRMSAGMSRWQDRSSSFVNVSRCLLGIPFTLYLGLGFVCMTMGWIGFYKLLRWHYDDLAQNAITQGRWTPTFLTLIFSLLLLLAYSIYLLSCLLSAVVLSTTRNNTDSATFLSQIRKLLVCHEGRVLIIGIIGLISTVFFPVAYGSVSGAPWNMGWQAVVANLIFSAATLWTWAFLASPKYAQRIAQTLFLIACLALPVSLAVFLGNGETQLRTEQELFQLNAFAAYLALLAAMLQVVPLLSRNQMVKSEREEATDTQRSIYGMLTWAAPVVLIFSLIHWTAREDFSHFASFRNPDLVRHDIVAWEPFVARMADAQQGVASGSRNMPRIHSTDRELLEKTREIHEQLILAKRVAEGWDVMSKRNLVSASGIWRDATGYFREYTPLLVSSGDASQEQAESSTPISTFFHDSKVVDKLQDDYLGNINSNLLGSSALTKSLLKSFFHKMGEANEGGQIPGSLRTQKQLGEWLERFVAQQKKAQISPWTPWAETQFTRRFHELMALSEEPGTLQAAPSNTNFSTALDRSITNLTEHERKTFNRKAMEILYPQVIKPRRMVSTPMVVDQDQYARAWWLVSWVSVFVVCLMLIDVNRASVLYHYYREKLNRTFLSPEQTTPVSPATLANAPISKLASEPLWMLQPQNVGMPIPLFCASRLTFPLPWTSTPRGPRGVVLSPISCGWQTDRPKSDGDKVFHIDDEFHTPSRSSEYWREWLTSEYGRHDQTLQLADAVTLSGAAATPMTTPNLPMALLLVMFNLRLGQWLPHPHNVPVKNPVSEGKLPETPAVGQRQDARATALDLIRGQLFRKHPGELRYISTSSGSKRSPLFLADGGFDDFLGAIELLRRRFRMIIVSDAGNNAGKEEFGSLAHLVELARTQLGVKLLDLDRNEPIDFERLRRDREQSNRTVQQFLCCRIQYPHEDSASPPTEGFLVYVQMSLTGLEELDLQYIRKHHPKFPDEPISNQKFTDRQVEAYRQLGYHIGRQLCRNLPPWQDSIFWDDAAARSGLVSQPCLSFDELRHRLQLSYFEDCISEHEHDSAEVSQQALFQYTVSAGRWKDVRAMFGNQESPEVIANDLLRAYETNADLRLTLRHLAWTLMRGETGVSSIDHQPVSVLDHEWESLTDSGQFVEVFALAVNDVLRFDPASSLGLPKLESLTGEMHEPPPTDLTRVRPRFKIGGQAALKANLEMAKLGKSPQSREGLATGIYWMAFDVFREQGPQTALQTLRCLLMLKGLRGKELALSTSIAARALVQRDFDGFSQLLSPLAAPAEAVGQN